jgi:hypothetical protein
MTPLSRPVVLRNLNLGMIEQRIEPSGSWLARERLGSLVLYDTNDCVTSKPRVSRTFVCIRASRYDAIRSGRAGMT